MLSHKPHTLDKTLETRTVIAPRTDLPATIRCSQDGKYPIDLPVIFAQAIKVIFALCLGEERKLIEQRLSG